MRILYIHGLDSAPNPERITCLEGWGHEVFALHLAYRTQPDAFSLLQAEISRHRVEYLVGSSLGGYLGFWLGESEGLPVLLYNPAMYLGEEGVGVSTPPALRCPSRHVVLGAKDDRVDPDWNWQWMQKQDRPGLVQRMILCEWLGHQIDLDTFAATAQWAGLAR